MDRFPRAALSEAVASEACPRLDFGCLFEAWESGRGNRGVGIEAWESRRGNRGGVWSTRLARRVARDQFSAQRHLGLLFAARHRVVMFA